MPKPAGPGLKRELGLWSATAIVVGTVIGSGIFLVPASMIQHVGTPGLVLLVWIFAGLLSLAGVLSYAELAAALPDAGGEYVFLREAYGPFWGFFYNWAMTWVGKAGGGAALATGFVYYLANFLPVLDRVAWTFPLPIGPGGGPLEITWGQPAAMALILFLGLINYYGVKLGGRVQVVMTAAKVGLIGAIVLIGLTWRGASLANYRSAIPAAGGASGFFAALVAALWAFDGWNNAVMVGSEVREPRRNLPRALIGGLLTTIVVYILANLAYFYVLPAAAVASSDRVAATMMRRVTGEFGAAAVSLAAMVSIFGSLNGSLLSGARIPYAAARDRLFFRAVGYVHPVHRTPSVAILGLSAWSALLVLSGRYEQLFTYVIFAEWLLYGMSAAAVVVLRRRRPELPRPYRTAGYPLVPVLFVLVAFCLLAATLVASPRESLMGLALIFGGVPFYFYWKRRALL